MSLDDVDDLHNAEDWIGSLNHVLSLVVARFDVATLAGNEAPDFLTEAIAAARVALAGDYCRPSCYGRKPTEDMLDDNDQLRDDLVLPDDVDLSYGWCDPVCGCPCHHGE